MTRRTSQLARLGLSNAQLVAIEIDTAVVALDRALGGWPEQTPGAAPSEAAPAVPCRNVDCTHIRPCPVHDDEPVKLTGPERAVEQVDPARVDLARLEEHVRLLAHHARAAAAITHRWAKDAITQSEVAEKLQAIWCRNCQRHGVNNPRDGEHLDCAECRRFRARWKRDATKAIIDARSRRRLSESDERRILDREKRDKAEADRAAERRLARAKRIG